MLLRFLVGCGGGDGESVPPPRNCATGYRGPVVALFSFVQAEFPWALGPSDGRYLVRDGTGGAEHVVVLATFGAPRRHLLRDRRTRRPTSPDPAPVSTARATVIDAAALRDEDVAREWLHRADGDTVHAALAVVNRVLFAHRIAAADPNVHELDAVQALVARAGFGEGEAVADGRWREAREINVTPRRMRRTAALRPQERLALLIGGRQTALAVEELVLRARGDLDAGRLLHAALELRNAYDIGLPELEAEGREDLAERLAELRGLHDGVIAAAEAGAPSSRADALEHALARLEAILRARTAAGFAAVGDDHERPLGSKPPPPRAGGA
jgi:hypothetical protein